jgi:hypothetical protein
MVGIELGKLYECCWELSGKALWTPLGVEFGVEIKVEFLVENGVEISTFYAQLPFIKALLEY